MQIISSNNKDYDNLTRKVQRPVYVSRQYSRLRVIIHGSWCRRVSAYASCHNIHILKFKTTFTHNTQH